MLIIYPYSLYRRGKFRGSHHHQASWPLRPSKRDGWRPWVRIMEFLLPKSGVIMAVAFL